MQILRQAGYNRLNDILRQETSGHQPVNEVGIQGMLPFPQRPGFKVTGTFKDLPDLRVCHSLTPLGSITGFSGIILFYIAFSVH